MLKNGNRRNFSIKVVALWSQIGPFEDNAAAILGLGTDRMVDQSPKGLTMLVVPHESGEDTLDVMNYDAYLQA